MEKLNRYIIGANASIFQKIDPTTNAEVFLPTNEEEIKEAITYARENNLPITTKGGGSGMSGACTGGLREKVVISTQRLMDVYELDFEKGYAVVAPGLTPDIFNALIQKEQPNWKFFVSPSSRDVATLGGMLSTDGGGNDAWLAGTMVDSTLSVELFDINNNKIIVERTGDDLSKSKITCDNKNLEKQLVDNGFSLLDIAGSHGVLGFISKIKVMIKPLPEAGKESQAIIHANTLDNFGRIIHGLIEFDVPLTYGETIVEARHPEISDPTNPPMFILKYPTEYDETVQAVCKNIENVDFKSIDLKEFKKFADIRVKMAKRNPPEGFQMALFEGYGIYGDNLLRFGEIIKTINESLEKHTFEPFIKFGHAPSVYYEDNKKIKGIIMHSREKRPKNLTPKVVFDGIMACVETCEKLRITPKPEHKWPYQKTTKKYKRLVELTNVLGKQFNPFLLECELEELAELVL